MFIMYPLNIKNHFKSVQHKQRQETKILLNQKYSILTVKLLQELCSKL